MLHRLFTLSTIFCCIVLFASHDARAGGSYVHQPSTYVRLDGQSSTYNSYSWTWDISTEFGNIQSAVLKLYFYDDDA